jgi:putative membrane protein
MIVYESNKFFLRDVFHLTRSWTMTKIVRGVSLIGAYSAAVVWPIEHYGFHDEIRLDPMIFSFLGIVLSILLVFRTNSAYDRWWEGRKQWGALVNHCRNLAIEIHRAFPDEDADSRLYLARRISNFCVALRDHLREGTKVEELQDLEEHERAVYASKRHVPNHIASEIVGRLQQVYRADGYTGEDQLNLHVHTRALVDILGACERIKKTPIPFSYAVHIKIFILVYGLLLPFALVSMFGLWAVLVVMFVFFAFLGLELMAEEIEGPFGLDCNDLPTGVIAQTIRENVFEILAPAQCPAARPAPVLYDKLH